ncbi:helix-turn-helix transcriptional regulator [Oscillospiraceae bacterium WX1]
MKPDFAKALTNLRRGKNFSQKKVADDLGISQALLSHYENGVREPKMEFIIKACDYYGVSADYILGRARQEACSDNIAMPCFTDGIRSSLDNAALLLSLLKDIGDDTLTASVRDYFEFWMYRILAALSRRPADESSMLLDAAIKISEDFCVAQINRVRRDQQYRRLLILEEIRAKYPESQDALDKLFAAVEESVRKLKTPSMG